ncbi:ArsR/SmtB family transcription factor [Williamsia muralis]|uniref:Transcriptional regulator n=1 Tax=Williamsia marianensis TaxID=85044 RepID=A0A2G3PJG0_WILMA|nr:metalloregulator ArsR/SmtB family transcription factor [Williamsia marianensis]PHV65940.1 transcriptional regulator [Williamsia marianensis]PZU02637.1 MAG: ArsR family transcriptional regulator [Gordonia sp. (in: high G+C Gram-positive bacteria)]
MAAAGTVRPSAENRVDKQVLDAAGELLRALSAPVRIAIVLELLSGGRCVHELVGALSVPQPLISQHLRVLKSAGVVEGRRSGREVLYTLVDDHLAHIVTDAIAHATEESTNGEARP